MQDLLKFLEREKFFVSKSENDPFSELISCCKLFILCSRDCESAKED